MNHQRQVLHSSYSQQTLHGPEHGNIIKITPLGYSTISNEHEWDSLIEPESKRFQDLRNNIVRFSSPSQSTQAPRHMTKFTENHEPSRELSRKTLKAFQLWNRHQSKIQETLTRQLITRQHEKERVYEWPSVSDTYSRNIGSIISEWSNQALQEKARKNSRVRCIYNMKYKARAEKEKENSINNRSKSKLDPMTYRSKLGHQLS